MNINELKIGDIYVFYLDSIIVHDPVYKSRFVDYEKLVRWTYEIEYISADYVIIQPPSLYPWLHCLLLNHKQIIEEPIDRLL